MVIVTYDKVSTIWAIQTVIIPLPVGIPISFFIAINSIKNEMPSTASGMIKGAAINPINNGFPLNFLNLVMTIAAMVPIITADVAVIEAIFKLVKVARKMMSSLNNLAYHLSENDVHVPMNLEPLKEYITMHNNGTYSSE